MQQPLLGVDPDDDPEEPREPGKSHQWLKILCTGLSGIAWILALYQSMDDMQLGKTLQPFVLLGCVMLAWVIMVASMNLRLRLLVCMLICSWVAVLFITFRWTPRRETSFSDLDAQAVNLASPHKATCGSASFHCDAGYVKMPGASTLDSPTNSKCCEATCGSASFQCNDGYVKMPSARDFLSPSNAICCEASCGSFQCDAGYGLTPSARDLVSPTNEKCCQASCASPSFQCDPGYEKINSASSLVPPTNEKCCEATCASEFFQCDPGYAKIPGASTLGSATNAACCQEDPDRPLDAGAYGIVTGLKANILPKMYGQIKEDTIWSYYYDPEHCPNSKNCVLPPMLDIIKQSIENNRGNMDYICLRQDEVFDYVNGVELPFSWKSFTNDQQKVAVQNALLARYGGVFMDLSTMLLKKGGLETWWDEMVNANAIMRGYVYTEARSYAPWFVMARRETIFRAATRDQVVDLGDEKKVDKFEILTPLLAEYDGDALPGEMMLFDAKMASSRLALPNDSVDRGQSMTIVHFPEQELLKSWTELLDDRGGEFCEWSCIAENDVCKVHCDESNEFMRLLLFYWDGIWLTRDWNRWFVISMLVLMIIAYCAIVIPTAILVLRRTLYRLFRRCGCIREDDTILQFQEVEEQISTLSRGIIEPSASAFSASSGASLGYSPHTIGAFPGLQSEKAAFPASPSYPRGLQAAGSSVLRPVGPPPPLRTAVFGSAVVQEDRPPSTAVVIPVELDNEQDIIQSTVLYIMTELEAPGPLDVFVVYNSSRGLPEVSGRLMNLETIDWGHVHSRSVKVLHAHTSTSKAGNILFARSHIGRYDNVAVFDADHIPDPCCLKTMYKKMLTEDLDCVQGSIYIRKIEGSLIDTFLARYIDAEFFVSHYMIFPAMHLISRQGAFLGSNTLMRREVLQKLEISQTMLTEDIDFTVQGALSGYDFAFVPNARTGELAPPSLGALYQQRRRWAIGWDQVSLKYAKLLLLPNCCKREKTYMPFKLRSGLIFMLYMRWFYLLSAFYSAIILPATHLYHHYNEKAIVEHCCGHALGLSERCLLWMFIWFSFFCIYEAAWESSHRGSTGLKQVLFVAIYMFTNPMVVAVQFVMVVLSLFAILTGNVRGWVVTNRREKSTPRRFIACILIMFCIVSVGWLVSVAQHIREEKIKLFSAHSISDMFVEKFSQSSTVDHNFSHHSMKWTPKHVSGRLLGAPPAQLVCRRFCSIPDDCVVHGPQCSGCNFCRAKPLCIDNAIAISCGPNTHLKSDPKITCAGYTCDHSDASICCEANALCKDYALAIQCAPHQGVTNSPDSYCKGLICDQSDSATCCEAKPSCKSQSWAFTCDDRTLLTTSDDALCGGLTCQPSDAALCCEAKAWCETMPYPCDDGFVLRTGSSYYCAGFTCQLSDKSECCQADGQCRDAADIITCDKNQVLRMDSGGYCADLVCQPSDKDRCCLAKQMCKDQSDLITCASGYMIPTSSDEYCDGYPCRQSDAPQCCQARAMCKDYASVITCDAAQHLKLSDDSWCAGTTCKPSDADACCEAKGKCRDAASVITCGPGHTLKRGDDDYCSGPTCDQSEKEHCCEVSNYCVDWKSVITCPAHYRFTQSSDASCPGKGCQASDTDACCEARAKCKDGASAITCSPTKIRKTVDDAYCSGPICDQSDEEHCCEAKAWCNEAFSDADCRAVGKVRLNFFAVCAGTTCSKNDTGYCCEATSPYEYVTHTESHVPPARHGQIQEKTIWLYYWDPTTCPNSTHCELCDLIDLCKESVVKNNGSFNVEFVYRDTVTRYVSLVELPFRWESFTDYKLQRDSAMNAILARYGGIALDQAAMVFKPFDTLWDEMVAKNSTFRGFMYRAEGDGYEKAQSTPDYFMMARKESFLHTASLAQVIAMGDDYSPSTGNKYADPANAFGDQTITPLLLSCDVVDGSFPTTDCEADDKVPTESRKLCPPKPWSNLTGLTDRVMISDPRGKVEYSFSYQNGSSQWSPQKKKTEWKEFMRGYCPGANGKKGTNFIVLDHRAICHDSKSLQSDADSFLCRWRELAFGKRFCKGPHEENATCDLYACSGSTPVNKGSKVECSGDCYSCDASTCCEAHARCDTFTCSGNTPVNKGNGVECLGGSASCDAGTCCEANATCDSYTCTGNTPVSKGNGVECSGGLASCDAGTCCEVR